MRRWGCDIHVINPACDSTVMDFHSNTRRFGRGVPTRRLETGARQGTTPWFKFEACAHGRCLCLSSESIAGRVVCRSSTLVTSLAWR